MSALAGLTGLAALAALVAPRSARAEAPATPSVRAVGACEPVAVPGRVRCSVEARIEAPYAVRWADLAVVGQPTFASPLKGRLAPEEATVREPGFVRWELGVVARVAGRGDLRLRVRLVACQGEVCVPSVVDVSAPVEVGR